MTRRRGRSASTREDTHVPKTIGVLIPTYKRSADLLRCLEALKHQERPPNDILLIVRREDEQTRSTLDAFDGAGLPLRVLLVDVPGTVYAHNVGIEASTTDVLAMIDDDTVPQPAWLRIVLEDFQRDPSLGGLGGRDRCFDGEAFDDRKADPVGRLQWFGRAIGNHHLGHGSIREVDLLKGANMSFRRSALEFARCDVRLRGRGAQPNEDTSLCLAVKRNGWRLSYDPAALVFHYPGARKELRHYGGVSRVVDAEGFQDFAYNEVIGVWDFFSPLRRAVFVLWSFFVGTGVCPGLVQAIRFSPGLGGDSWRRFALTQKAKISAVVHMLGARSAKRVS